MADKLVLHGRETEMPEDFNTEQADAVRLAQERYKVLCGLIAVDLSRVGLEAHFDMEIERKLS